MPVVLSGATSGSTTIQATDAVTATLTLPSSTGTLLSTTSPKAGNVIQVVQATSTSLFSTSSTSFVTTGFSASITPQSTSSKILVICDLSVENDNGTTSGSAYAIYRGGSNIYPTGQVNNANLYVGNTNIRGRIPMNFMDSPATTSSVTYTIYFEAYAPTAYLNNDGSTSSITLMEISG